MAQSDDQPIYDQQFYRAIIAERRQAGSNGYVNVDECMATMGRTWGGDSVTVKSDNDSENE